MNEQQFKEAMTSIESGFEDAIVGMSKLEIPMSNPVLKGYRLIPTDSRGLVVTSYEDLMAAINNHLDALRNSYKHELEKLDINHYEG